MFKKFIIIFSSIFLLKISSGQTKEITINVDGMVCEFCAITIEKNFQKKEEIEEVTIDLDKKQILLILKYNKDLSDEEIAKIIKNNGYNLVEINREKDY